MWYNGKKAESRVFRMNVIVCLDDKNGMMFNGRRQSRDRILCARAADLAAGRTLWMNEYSAPLFPPELAPRTMIRGDFLSRAGRGDYCFVENAPLVPHEEQIETLFVFRWNRVYPADTRLDLPLERWQKVRTEEFAGSSHEAITMEVYER